MIYGETSYFIYSEKYEDRNFAIEFPSFFINANRKKNLNLAIERINCALFVLYCNVYLIQFCHKKHFFLFFLSFRQH